MPDFDVDFCMDGRDRVIDYVRRTYGETSVGQIATFHLLKSRSVVRDVWAILAQTRHPMDTEAAPDARPPRATSTLLPPPFPRPRTSVGAA